MSSATAGYKARISVGGTPTSMADAACSLVGGQVYQVDDSDKRVIDPRTSCDVSDDGVLVSASNYSIDWLLGIITFVNSYTVVGDVAITADYIPRIVVANIKSADVERSTQLEAADVLNSDGWRRKVPTLKDLKVSLSTFDTIDTDLDPGAAELTFLGALTDGEPMMVEFDENPDSGTPKVLRAWVLLDAGKTAWEPGMLENATISGSMAAQGNPLTGAGYSYGTP